MSAGTSSLIVATANDIEGRPVQDYLGIVSAEAVVRTSVATRRAARSPRRARARYATFENRICQARQEVIDEMCKSAAELGATAIIAVEITYTHVPLAQGNVLIVSASGTAVTL